MLARGLVAVVAALHVGFMILESFLWTKPLGRRVFRQSLEHARLMRVLAANQGLYNLFLAAGLGWGLIHPDPAVGAQVATFFLGCVVAAGVVGGVTAARGILVVQALPGVLALASVLLHGFR